MRAIEELRWAELGQLPNIVFIRSQQGHHTIADVVMPLIEASPVFIEHLAQIRVHALSSPKALAEGLEAARKLCVGGGEPWCVALVRGGGAPDAMEKFARVLGNPLVRPLLEELAPRLIFAAGHTRDSKRVAWLKPLVAGMVPYDAGVRFVELLRTKGVLRVAHAAADAARNDAVGLPTPEDLPRARFVRENERHRLHVNARYAALCQAATILPDHHFVEVLARGGYLMGFWPVGGPDFRAVAISQDYVLYLSDATYDLVTWRDILESLGVEDWEIEEALEKVEFVQPG